MTNYKITKILVDGDHWIRVQTLAYDQYSSIDITVAGKRLKKIVVGNLLQNGTMFLTIDGLSSNFRLYAWDKLPKTADNVALLSGKVDKIFEFLGKKWTTYDSLEI